MQFDIRFIDDIPLSFLVKSGKIRLSLIDKLVNGYETFTSFNSKSSGNLKVALTFETFLSLFINFVLFPLAVIIPQPHTSKPGDIDTWPMDKDSVRERDVSGFYVLCVFFRLFFLLRDYMPFINRKDASMITWIQVVGASMIKFFLVSPIWFLF